MFCGGTFVPGERGEDIIPRWYAKAIGHPTTGTVQLGFVEPNDSVFFDPELSQTVAAKQFRVRYVCPGCNSAWMSVIENEAKPHLLPMTQGTAVELDADAQRDIATWAQLKAILWDHHEHPQLLPVSTASTSRATRPLYDLAVTIGHVESDSPMTINIVKQLGSADVGTGATPVLRVTISFHHLVVQVSTVLDGALPVELLREMSGPFAGIWPPPIGNEQRTVRWPPGPPLTAAELYRHL
jgi:hypothetical protein